MLVQPNRQHGKLKTDHPHMGIASLAAYSIQRGHETSAVDAMYEGIDNGTVLSRILSFRPDVLGFTSKTPDIYQCATLSNKVKGVLSNTITVVGGAHITALGKRVLQECSSFDYGVVGEGELTFSELLDSIDGKTGHESRIAGLIFRNGGSIYENALRSPISNLDVLLYPAWHLFPRGTDFPLFTSRGCPFKCTFCQRVMGNEVRTMSPERIVDDIERSIKDHGARYFQIEDETFGVNKHWTNQLLDLILRKSLNKKISWAANSRVNLADLKIYKKMKEAGCGLLGFGIESGNQDILNSIHKGIKLEKAERAIATARQAGIRTSAFFILGHPNETPRSVRDTINFACKLNPDMVCFGMMIPYPGTKIYEMAKANEGGYRNLSEDWSRYTKYLGGAMELVNFKKSKLARYQKQAYIEFYIRNMRIGDLLPIVKRYLNKQT